MSIACTKTHGRDEVEKPETCTHPDLATLVIAWFMIRPASVSIQPRPGTCGACGLFNGSYNIGRRGPRMMLLADSTSTVICSSGVLLARSLDILDQYPTMMRLSKRVRASEVKDANDQLVRRHAAFDLHHHSQPFDLKCHRRNTSYDLIPSWKLLGQRPVLRN